MSSTTTQTLIAKRIRKATKHAVSTLGFVPEDKLDYRPTESANSCRSLAQHIVMGNCLVLKSLGVETKADSSEPDLELLKIGITETGAQLAEFAEAADVAAIDGTVEFFGNPIPMAELLLIAEWHISRHTGQIDFLETTWGDLEDHQ